ncbi:MAG TPA: hypothetical protein PKC39_02360 [Ferruginibacter sp.]|nr:hypothetical protein [Ferruginibacter sp.]HMP19778.1 hypothetical protein [Ferruginibacter sp.]
MRILLIIIAAALLLPNFIHKDITAFPDFDGKEEYNPALAYLNSIDKLEYYTDSIVATRQCTTASFDDVLSTVMVVRSRFYHGFSHFSLHENWMAALAGRFIEEGLACKVQPKDIIQHQNAACSQQSIVVMELLRRKNIPYRKVGFPHHYALEAYVEGHWYFFDPDMEPTMTKEQRNLAHWQHNNDMLKQYYDTSRYTSLDYQFGNNQMAIVGSVNEVPAANVKKFHALTQIASRTAWLLPLLLLAYRHRPFFRLKFQRQKPQLSFSP